VEQNRGPMDKNRYRALPGRTSEQVIVALGLAFPVVGRLSSCHSAGAPRAGQRGGLSFPESSPAGVFIEPCKDDKPSHLHFWNRMG
jgi:hypothetical protein